MKKSNPMPTVTYKDSTYKLKSRKTEIPDFNSMSNFSVLIWLNQNTTARGYSKHSNPLMGMGGVIGLN